MDRHKHLNEQGHDHGPLEIIDDQAEHLFTNLVSFNINAEEVSLGFGIRNTKGTNEVDIHTYMHMTIPHFLRFADTVNHQIGMLIERGVISKETEQ
ncbi:MAG TPA: hypothetical protein VK186_12645 [Candidatus Deferrimicrobium sp.]|nr:hypothetical protein [Candidatus Deferrimicrobium sp.]